jgi:hypothetical protein
LASLKTNRMNAPGCMGGLARGPRIMGNDFGVNMIGPKHMQLTVKRSI